MKMTPKERDEWHQTIKLLLACKKNKNFSCPRKYQTKIHPEAIRRGITISTKKLNDDTITVTRTA